ncbi:MAG: indole-3-glycerol-phosphate synthase TrpC, partial [Candidatus Daviesbacteria bacterium]|nr:indole-3-glycerol-phosphate synthase TrpC [Candidatus Daviesbacteria bacterium]
MVDDILVIAEIKFASLTEPHLGKRSDLINRAKQYEQAGVDAISLIIEQRIFKGDLSDVVKVKKHVSLPILVKD